MTTEARAVSAWKLWLTPLAVLVPILATIATMAAARSAWGVPAVLGIALTAFCGSRTYGTLLAAGTAVLTLAASGLALFIVIAVALGSSTCKDVGPGWTAFALVCGGLVYLLLGTAVLRFKPWAALAVVPAGLILGVLTAMAVMDHAPGPSYFCGD